MNALLLAALCLGAPPDDGETSTSTAVRTEKRAMPDLDGRPEPGPDAGDVALWIPRTLLAPVHLITEWGIRRPLGFVLTEAEKGKWADVLVDFLTFQDRKIGVIPTFFVDFNFRPSVGVYVFWNELFVEPHSIRLTAGYGGSDWYRVSFLDRWQIDDTRLEFGVGYLGRPDYIYSGEGASGDVEFYHRYFQEHIEGQARLLYQGWRRSELRIEAGVRKYRFGNGDPEEGEAEDDLALAPVRPEGFDSGYTSLFQRALVRLDTRPSRPAPSHGFVLEVQGAHGVDLESELYQWIRFGGTVGVYVDLGHHRTLGLSGQAQIANPLEGKAIPFTELVTLGSHPNDLSGFLPGVLRGRSAAWATLEYTYPIWVFLDGALQYSVGNTFGADFAGFEAGAMRSSIGIGIQSSREEDNGFQFLFALGTSRFDEAFEIQAIRLVLGTEVGF